MISFFIKAAQTFSYRESRNGNLRGIHRISKSIRCNLERTRILSFGPWKLKSQSLPGLLVDQ